MLGWERSLSLNPGVDPARASIGHSAREAAGVWQPCPPPDIPLRSIRPPDHQDGAAIVPTVSKRKPDAFPGRQPSAKMPKLEPDGSPSFSTPPCNPPGEAFAANFMREYVDRGGLLTRQVTGLASNPARKWGLACELPAGWYVIDDHPGPGQILQHYDASATPPCGWKVTGPQMKVFNPDVPVQIRYGNPKDGCTKDYGAMRAAVYTWCRKDAAGAVVEGPVKLIHVYVGRASRNRNGNGNGNVRPSRGRRRSASARKEALAVRPQPQIFPSPLSHAACHSHSGRDLVEILMHRYLCSLAARVCLSCAAGSFFLRNLFSHLRVRLCGWHTP